jgi:hypothetical protein
MGEMTLGLFRFCSVLASILMFACVARSQPGFPTEGKMKKAVSNLGSSIFRTRQQGEKVLIEFGDAALPTLRVEARSNVALETKRRIENVIERIESDWLAAEAKNWGTLEAPPYVKDRLVKLMARKPALSEAHCVKAIYLLIANRRPSESETTQACKKFRECNFPVVSTLRIARPLVRNHGENIELIYTFSQVEKENANPNVFSINAFEIFGRALGKNVRKNADFADILFLFILSRYPNAQESAAVLTALAETGDRERTAWHLVNALRNTEESKSNR